MEYRRCQPPCARFIACDDPHSKYIKCLGFSHAREAVYGISKCKFCENLCLITLRSRLEACEKESSIFPRRAPEASEHHLWLNLTEIREKEKVFLLDAPISQSGLFGEAVSSVVDKFRSAKTQSADLKQFMPRRSRDYSTPSSLSREQSLPRKSLLAAVAPRLRTIPQLRFGERLVGPSLASNHADGLT